MFQLQIKFNKQGEWENTVYRPMDKVGAEFLLNQYNTTFGKSHSYRLVSV